MKFICDRCQTRYSIADEKVRQKILRIRCKTCGGVILVQESSALPEAAAGDASPHAAQPFPANVPSGLKLPAPAARTSTAPKATLTASAKAPSEPKPASLSPSKPSWLRPPTLEGPKARVAAPPPPPPPSAAHDHLGGRVEWYVAVAGTQSGPFSRAEAAKRVLAVDPSQVVHVWKEGMAGWKSADEVSVIVREINLLRPAPPPPPPPAVHEGAKASPTPPPLSSSSSRVATGAEPAGASAGKLAPSQHSSSKVAEVLEFHAEADTDADIFTDVATEKRKREGDATSVSPSFSDVTTKKGKDLRHLEMAPLPAPSAVHLDDPKKTPAPLSASPVAALPIRADLAAGPTLPNPASFIRTGKPSEPVLTLERDGETPPNPTTPLPSFAGAFSDVVAAMATAAPSISATGPAPTTVAPVRTGAFAVPTAPMEPGRSRLVDLVHGRSGLKYLVAAVISVALVILVVVLSLRGDTAKRAEASKEPAKETTPVAEPSAAIPPEEPGVAPAVEEKVPTPPRAGGKHAPKTRSVGPERPVVTERSVGPVERPVVRSGRSSADAPRPNPFGDNGAIASQEKISAVVRDKNNQMALKSCYERALKMDNRLTSGRMDITVSIAPSGSVERVVVNAPSAFIMVEPCIKTVVRRWHFPANNEDYATNFPLIMQGGM